ncbi:ABC transporter [Lactobacillus crispatus]|nr:ABC transporter [Lactobacillus crispatus]
MCLLRIKDLKVNFKDQTVLDFRGHDIEIKSGDKVALIGKNGAGKSTLLNCLLHEVKYTGCIKEKYHQSDIGVVFQENVYFKFLKVYEIFELVWNKPKKLILKSKFIKNFNLASIMNKYISDLSGGEKQRLTIALVFSQNKKIYLLDEINSGLDYDNRHELSKIINNITEEKTVIQISHYFEEVENWANKLIILDRGKMIYFESLSKFYSINKHDSLIIINDKKSLSRLTQKPLNLYSNKYIVSSSIDERHDITNLLEQQKIDYKVVPQNLYTTYKLALVKHEDR